MSKKSKKPEIPAPKRELEILVDGGAREVHFRVVEKKEKVEPPPEPKKKYSEAWYNWYYKYATNHRPTLWNAYITSEDTCCSFDVLSGFTTGVKLTDEECKMIADVIGAKFKKVNRYVAAYVPNTGEYTTTKKIIEGAGLVAGISTKSIHGQYTNTRWEWFPDDTKQCVIPETLVPHTKRVNEKTVPTLAI